MGETCEKAKIDKKKPDEWEIQDMARTIIRAEEIKNDKTKMKYVLPEINKQIKALENVKASLKVPSNKQELFEELTK